MVEIVPSVSREPMDRREHTSVSQQSGYEHTEHVVEDVAAERRFTLFRTTNFIWLIAGVLEILLGLRFLLKLIAANPNSGFAVFIYDITGVFLAPFAGLTATPAAKGVVLEVPTLIAMLVYAIFFWLAVRLIWLLFDHPAARAITTYERAKPAPRGASTTVVEPPTTRVVTTETEQPGAHVVTTERRVE